MTEPIRLLADLASARTARGTAVAYAARMGVEVAHDGPGVPHLVDGSEKGGYGLHLLEAV